MKKQFRIVLCCMVLLSSGLLAFYTEFDESCLDPAGVLVMDSSDAVRSFTSIKTAVDSITYNSSSNPVTVYVAAGTYTEDTITLKPYVYLLGEDPATTIIEVDATSKDIIVGAANSRVSNFTLQGATDASKSAIKYAGGDGEFAIENCIFGANNILINQTATAGDSRISLRNSSAIAASDFATAFLIFTLTNMAVLYCDTFTWSSATNPNISDFIATTGNNVILVLSNVSFGHPAATYAASGFDINNGIRVDGNNVTIQGFNEGIWLRNGQTVKRAYIHMVNTTINSCGDDINIAAIAADGLIQGSFDPLKTVNSSSIVLDDSAPTYSVDVEPA